MTSTDPSAVRSTRKRRGHEPEAAAEAATVLRLLMVRPWLVAGRDDAPIATVRRNETAVRDAIGRLGWVLTVERDFVRLRKSPPVRRDAWANNGPNPLTCSWFFLLVAAAESMPPRLSIGQLVAAARIAAAEVGIPTPDDKPERYAILAALKMLDERGVVESIDGDVNEFLHDDGAPVLLAVHHHRLVHVIANYGTADPIADPAGWLSQVEREADPARRMRRRLVDDTAVYACDLDPAEADWLSRRVRSDDGLPMAEAFGLHLERRAEGAAFIVPVDAFRSRSELGDFPFPAGGTVAHAALLLCDAAATDGVVNPGLPGWRGMRREQVVDRLSEFAQRYAGRGWSAEHVDNPVGLADEVLALLTGAGLVRVDLSDMWWLSPATGRWERPQEPRPTTQRQSRAALDPSVDGQLDLETSADSAGI